MPMLEGWSDWTDAFPVHPEQRETWADEHLKRGPVKIEILGISLTGDTMVLTTRNGHMVEQFDLRVRGTRLFWIQPDGSLKKHDKTT